MWNVYQARRKKGLSFLGTLPQLMPIILFFVAHYAWLLSPYSHILENNGLMRVSLTMTFVFARMTRKITLESLAIPLLPPACLVEKGLPLATFAKPSVSYFHKPTIPLFLICDANHP